MSYVTVLPSIYQPWTDRCLEHCRLDRVVIVDNTTVNLGVATSWNIGVRVMRAEAADWLIILSAAIRFNTDFGGLDLVAELEANPDAYAVEAGHGMGWHLIAFHRRAFDLVGEFDENFYPAYLEDNDFGRRLLLGLGGHPPLWPKVSVEVGLQGFCHGVDLGGAATDPDLMAAYYQAKWGGPPSREEFASPFNLAVGLDHWPPPCARCRYPLLAHDEHSWRAVGCTHYTEELTT